MPSDLPTIAPDQLEPGSTLPHGLVHGKLHMLWKDLGGDNSNPRITFQIRTRVKVSSDYIAPSSLATTSPKTTFLITFTLFPDKSLRLSSDAVKTLMLEDRSALFQAFKERIGLPLSVECHGARVVSRLRQPGEGKGDGPVVITVESVGRRNVIINGNPRILLDMSRNTPLCGNSRPAMSATTVLPQFSGSTLYRPISALAGQLTFSADFNRTRTKGTIASHTSLRSDTAPNSHAGLAFEGQNATVSSTLDRSRSRAPYQDKSFTANTRQQSPSPPQSLLPNFIDLTSSRPETIEPASSSAEASENNPEVLPSPCRGSEQIIDIASPSHQVDTKLTGPLGSGRSQDNETGAQKGGHRSATYVRSAESDYVQRLPRKAVNHDARKEQERRERDEAVRNVQSRIDTALNEDNTQRLALHRMRNIMFTDNSDVSLEDVEPDQPWIETPTSVVNPGHKRPLEDTTNEVASPKRPRRESDHAPEPMQLSPGFSAAKRNRAAAEAVARQRALEWEKSRQQEERQILAARESLRHIFTAANGLTYTPIRDLRDHETFNVMGVIIGLQPPKPAMGSRDAILTMVITDPSAYTSGRASEDLTITVFRQSEAELGPFAVGHAVAFRDLRMKPWNGKPKGHAFRTNPSCTWAMLNNGRIVPGAGQYMLPAVNAEETSHLQALEEWWKAQGNNDQAMSSGGTMSPGTAGDGTAAVPTKVGTLGSVVPAQFLTVTVKVMAVHPCTSGPKYELYVTDGTVNPSDTRNFHGVDARIPASAVFCLAIFSTSSDGDEELFQPGNIIRFPNVRVKERHGQLELVWSENITSDQLRDGWKKRQCALIPKGDDRALEIENRIRDLKAGNRGAVAQCTPPQAPFDNASFSSSHSTTYHLSGDAPSTAAPVNAMSLRAGTTHKNAIDNPVSTLAEVMDNRLVPNKYRIHARVVAIVPRGHKSGQLGDLAVLWCTKCKRPFKDVYCKSCNDTTHIRSKAVWQMWLYLEPPESEATSLGQGTVSPTDEAVDIQKRVCLPVILSHDEAEIMLPPLPQVRGPELGPNEINRARRRIAELTPRVEELLLGPKLDGVRQRPIIDWSIACESVKCQRGKKEFDERVVFQVFGMRRFDSGQ